eukprot:s313_g34.t1
MPDYGFDVAKQSHEDAKQSHSDVKAPSEGYEQSIDADIPEEAPVDPAEGEPLAEDRVVLRGPDEAVFHIDGVALTMDSTLRALRAGCEALGLSKRGSKELCMKRMLDHIQTQTLLAAHSAEMRLKADAEREVRGQKIPKVPTQAEVDNHNLTHEPFRDWCELCTMYRARQDKHVPSTHEHSGHSVISYDFGYCARMPGEDDKQTCLVLKDRDTQLVHVIPTIQKGGTTAFERSSDRVYTGKLAMFGECVLGFLKSGDKKAAPRWQKGIWLGKSLTNDTHIIAQGNDVFVTRSIRRLPTPFVLEALGDMVACPWSYGYAALGHRMVYSRQLSPPMPFGVGSGLPPAAIDAEAIQVQRYAEEHPNEDLDAPELGEAGPRDAVEGPKPVEMDVQS